MELGEPSIERSQAGDPLPDRPATRREHGRQRGRSVGAMAFLAPPGDPGRIRQRDIQLPQPEQQTSALELTRTVLPIPVLGSRRPWKEPIALVEPQRVGAHRQLASQLTDLHGPTFALDRFAVKPQPEAVGGRRPAKPAARS